MEGEQMKGGAEKASRPLTLQEFTEERANNIFLYFVPGDFGDLYRSKEAYKHLEEERPELVDELRQAYSFTETAEIPVLTPDASPELVREVFEHAARRSRTFKEHKALLREAYLAMRAHTKNDKGIFS